MNYVEFCKSNHIVRWWESLLLWWLPTYHFPDIEEGVMVEFKRWRGRIVVWDFVPLHVIDCHGQPPAGGEE